MKTERTKPEAIAESKNKPALEKEGQRLNDRPAARGIIVENREWIAFERGVSAPINPIRRLGRPNRFLLCAFQLT
jgi:hypothetical protein